MNVRETEFGPVPVPVTAENESEMLQEIYRRLVCIHGSVAEATNGDTEIVPWTELELRGLVRGLGAFLQEQRRSAKMSPAPASASQAI
jgi:hypothetical protein